MHPQGGSLEVNAVATFSHAIHRRFTWKIPSPVIQQDPRSIAHQSMVQAEGSFPRRIVAKHDFARLRGMHAKRGVAQSVDQECVDKQFTAGANIEYLHDGFSLMV